MKGRNLLPVPEWNIGFVGDVGEVLDERTRGTEYLKVEWMKHNVYGSWFADPFIYKVTDDVIEVLVEQKKYLRKRGILSKLTVDRATKRLLKVKPILKLKTHLSYPFIIRDGDEVYIMPENGASGLLTAYRFDGEKMEPDRVVVEEGLSDATIVKRGGEYYLFGGKQGVSVNEELYMWQSNEMLNGYGPRDGVLVKSGYKGSRMAGAFVEHEGVLYRFSQDCEVRYGHGVVVHRVEEMSECSLREETVKEFYPEDSYYNLGIHTMNFHQGIGVVDGKGLRRGPFMKMIPGRMESFMRDMKHRIERYIR